MFVFVCVYDAWTSHKNRFICPAGNKPQYFITTNGFRFTGGHFTIQTMALLDESFILCWILITRYCSLFMCPSHKFSSLDMKKKFLYQAPESVVSANQQQNKMRKKRKFNTKMKTLFTNAIELFTCDWWIIIIIHYAIHMHVTIQYSTVQYSIDTLNAKSPFQRSFCHGPFEPKYSSLISHILCDKFIGIFFFVYFSSYFCTERCP